MCIMASRWKYRPLYPSCVRDSAARARFDNAMIDSRILDLKWSHFNLLGRACARLKLPAEDVLDLAAALFSLIRRGHVAKDVSAADAAVDAAVLRVQEAERELRLARNAERQARARRAEEVRADKARSGGA